MVPVDEEVLKEIRPIIAAQFKTLSDLPEELANTIANIYYRSCLVSRDTQRGFIGVPGMADNYSTAMDSYIREATFLSTSLESLPGIIASLRKIPATHRRDYDNTVLALLAWYKHRIESAFDAPLLWIRLRLFLKGSGSTEGEIPGLSKLIERS